MASHRPRAPMPEGQRGRVGAARGPNASIRAQVMLACKERRWADEQSHAGRRSATRWRARPFHSSIPINRVGSSRPPPVEGSVGTLCHLGPASRTEGSFYMSGMRGHALHHALPGRLRSPRAEIEKRDCRSGRYSPVKLFTLSFRSLREESWAGTERCPVCLSCRSCKTPSPLGALYREDRDSSLRSE